MSATETVLSSSRAPTSSAEDRVTLTPPNTSSLPTPTFTPEPSCTRDIYFAIYTVDDIQCMIGDEVVACRYHHLGPTTSASECLPSDWATSDGVYTTMAPCPDGYTFACAASSEGEDKTTATCCPSGWQCNAAKVWPWDLTEHCVQTLPSTIDFVYTTVRPGEEPQVVTQAPAEGHVIYAYGLEVQYESTDLINPATITSTESTSQTTSTRPPISTTDGSNDGEGGGLSTAAQAGIGVGLGALGLFLIAGALWFWRRRRNQLQQKVEEHHVTYEAYGSSKTPPHPYHQTSELSGSHGEQRYEMYTQPSLVELPNYRQ